MGTRVLLIDNYDSFTYNLAQSLAVLGAEVDVRRNDSLSVKEAVGSSATHLVISPGPGWPSSAGITLELLRASIGRLPVLGVCLGHQSIVTVLGGTVTHAPRLMHGKASPIVHDEQGLFAGLPTPLEAARYHSLIVSGDDLPGCLEVTARTAEEEIMAVRHLTHHVFGLQFHPESVLTPRGDDLLANFLRVEGGGR